jgi:hypothetical protein
MPPDGQVNLHMLYETMGEVKVIAREAKHAAANASAKIDALAVVVATQGTMREDVEELKREVKDLVQEKHRREGAIGLVEWLSRHWPFLIACLGLAAWVAFANGLIK